MWCPDDGFTMSDLLQDRIDLFRPDERFGILVVDLDEIFDRGDEFRDTAENPATNAFARDLSEPSLHQVQPGRTGRREMEVETGMLFQPRFDLGVVVRAVVVQNHVDGQLRGHGAVDLAQELPEFDVPMSRITGADDLPFQHVQRREQARGAVAFVVMGHGLAAPLLHRQAGLRPVQRLNLTLLVDAQHHRLVRRIQVHPHHVRQFLDKPLVLGQLECIDPMGLKTVRVPYPLHRRFADPLGFCHRTHGPMRGIARYRLESRIDNGLHPVQRKSLGTRAVGCILGQAHRSMLLEAFAPLNHRWTGGGQLGRNGVVRHTVRRQQANARPQDGSLGAGSGPLPRFQCRPLLVRHHQSVRFFPHATESTAMGLYCQDISGTLH